MVPISIPIGAGQLRVCHTEKFKVGLLSVSAVLPIERKTVWLTSLLLSVLCRGTCRYPSMAELNRRLDYLYGTELTIRNFRRGDAHVIGFSADILDASCLPEGEELIPAVAELMREILFHPLLDENGLLTAHYVESEKQQQIDSLRAMKNNPGGYAFDRFRMHLYETEPCGAPIYGSEEEIMAVTPEQLTAHWHDLLSRLTPDCFYVGAQPRTDLGACLADALFSELPSKAAAPAPKSRRLPPRAALQRAEEELEVTQSQLLLGFSTETVLPDADYAACMVLCELLGGSAVSKLFLSLRERLSLCYFCSARYYSYKGAIVVHCGLDAENRELAEREILAQVRAVTEGDFSEEELFAAKKSLQSSFRRMEDSAAGMENYYYSRSLVGVERSVDDTLADFWAVKREDLLRAAEKLRLHTVYFLRGTRSGEEDEALADD